MTTPAPARVVYIAGAQHCGSTMLDAILGNAPGAASLGEVGGFHRVRGSTACDCRQPAGSCRPCRSALAALEGSGDLPAFEATSSEPLKERRAHWTLVGSRRRADYARVADVLLDAAAEATGSTILVDSSKNVSRAAALLHDNRHDVVVIHLVRDGRGYLRSKLRRAGGGRRVLPAPIRLLPWLAKNLLISVPLRLAAPPGRYLLVRYEDLVADPERELGRIAAFTGLDTGSLARRATTEGLPRHHLFEPRRQVDYRIVRVDAGRLGSQRQTRSQNRRYWLGGGFVSRLWGYDRDQRYLREAG